MLTGCTPLANSAATLSEVSSQLQQQEAPAQEDQSQDDVLLYEDDVRGVWISYIELQSMMQDHTQQDFAYYARVVLNTAKTQGINTVFVQVRSHGDAIYLPLTTLEQVRYPAQRGRRRTTTPWLSSLSRPMNWVFPSMPGSTPTGS